MALLRDPNPLVSERTPEVVFNNAFPGQDMNIERVISAPGFFGLYPLQEKKNRIRPCIVVLRNCLCEVHKSSKDIVMCRPAKHLIDLRQVFNVCIIKETIELKSTCLCVMTPSETYYLAPDKDKTDFELFYEEFLERSRDARSTMLVRPVFKDEYFEASWDVMVVHKPKLRKNYGQAEQFEDLLDRHPELGGRRRLCVRNASLVFFKMEIRPSSDTEAPYSRECFFDFPVNVISRYGRQECYFFLQIGRCAEYGQGEIWMLCEDGSTAKYMHDRVDEINQRESDRRKAQGIKLTFPGISQRVIKSKAHRERSHTQHQHELEIYSEAYRQQVLQKKRDAERLAEEEAAAEAAAAEGKENEQTGETDEANEDEAKEEENSEETKEVKKDEKKKEKFKGFFGSKKPKDAQSSTPTKRGTLAGLMSFRFRKSFFLGGDKSADSEKKTKDEPPTSACSTVYDPPDYHPHNSFPQYNHQLEDYVAYDHKVDFRKAPGSIPTTIRQISVPAAPREPRRIVSVPKDYVQMETTPEKPPPAEEQVHIEYNFPLQEVRSYIYDSNDSCNSPLARSLTNSTASTYAHPFQNHAPAHTQMESSYAYFEPTPVPHQRQYSGERSQRPSTSGLSASGGRTYSLGARPILRGVDLRTAARTAKAAVASASASLTNVESIAEEEVEEEPTAGSSSKTRPKSHESGRRRRSKRESKPVEIVNKPSNKHDSESSDELERLERGDAMYTLSEVPPTDSLMAKDFDRPRAKSIGGRAGRHRNRTATTTTNGPTNEAQHSTVSRLKHTAAQQ